MSEQADNERRRQIAEAIVDDITRTDTGELADSIVLVIDRQNAGGLSRDVLLKRIVKILRIEPSQLDTNTERP
jgi:hypothetical protein